MYAPHMSVAATRVDFSYACPSPRRITNEGDIYEKKGKEAVGCQPRIFRLKSVGICSLSTTVLVLHHNLSRWSGWWFYLTTKDINFFFFLLITYILYHKFSLFSNNERLWIFIEKGKDRAVLFVRRSTNWATHTYLEAYGTGLDLNQRHTAYQANNIKTCCNRPNYWLGW